MPLQRNSACGLAVYHVGRTGANGAVTEAPGSGNPESGQPMTNYGQPSKAHAKWEVHVIPGGVWLKRHPETRVRNPSSAAGCVSVPLSPALETHIMYSSLFSSVTRMLSPPSFSSWVVTLPKISMSWMKYSSRPHSSRLFSLGGTRAQREDIYLTRVFPSSCSITHF